MVFKLFNKSELIDRKPAFAHKINTDVYFDTKELFARHIEAIYAELKEDLKNGPRANQVPPLSPQFHNPSLSDIPGHTNGSLQESEIPDTKPLPSPGDCLDAAQGASPQEEQEGDQRAALGIAIGEAFKSNTNITPPPTPPVPRADANSHMVNKSPSNPPSISLPRKGGFRNRVDEKERRTSSPLRYTVDICSPTPNDSIQENPEDEALKEVANKIQSAALRIAFKRNMDITPPPAPLVPRADANSHLVNKSHRNPPRISFPQQEGFRNRVDENERRTFEPLRYTVNICSPTPNDSIQENPEDEALKAAIRIAMAEAFKRNTDINPPPALPVPRADTTSHLVNKSHRNAPGISFPQKEGFRNRVDEKERRSSEPLRYTVNVCPATSNDSIQENPEDEALKEVTNKILHWIEACQKRLQVCIGPTG
jgi:hypothetical protein